MNVAVGCSFEQHELPDWRVGLFDAVEAEKAFEVVKGEQLLGVDVQLLKCFGKVLIGEKLVLVACGKKKV